MKETQPVGSVMVVGGGVAGMQSALDLVESGYKVYLVEKESAIGGKMAQLDKTFPSNDCAMCILAPRLVAVGKHPDIEIITNAEVEHLDGEPGHFYVTLKRKGTFVDPLKCTGCGLCAERCTVELPNLFNLGLNKRKAIYRAYPQAVPNVFNIAKNNPPPCRVACPAGANVQGYVSLIASGLFQEAINLVRERMPFAAVCGRICNHLCEQECNRNLVDEPVSIMRLKRFIADWDYENRNPFPPPVEKTKEDRIAVVGGGPAGLTTAHNLAKKGYPVTLFESMSVLGGMLRFAVPEFRLPDKQLDRDIEYLLHPGIDVQLNKKLGEDFTIEDLQKQGYRAIFLAIGAHKGKRLPIPGSDLHGIHLNIDFLREARVGVEPQVGRRTLVIGGGNVAIDVARTAKRLGADEVIMACLESRETMPAHPWEIAEAESEGIKVIAGVTFKRFLGNNHWVEGIECARVSSMSFDKEGRLSVVEISNTTFTIPADRVIVAIGQSPDLTFIHQQSEIEVNRRGLIEVNPATLGTGKVGVFAGGDVVTESLGLAIFAGGDVVTGTAFVVNAVAAGHKASDAIERYLEGRPFAVESRVEPQRFSPERVEQKLNTGELKTIKRNVPPIVPVEQRLNDFQEVELGFTQEQAIADAQRCLNCGLCCECFQCVSACQANAIDHSAPRVEKRHLEVGAVVLTTGFDCFDASLKEEYGYHRFPNVISSLEFERILSPSGPFAGHVQRISDGKTPKKIAFIQCVGSREKDKNYCSSVCCMYAMKEAVIAKEHEPGIDFTIFYIDLRAFAKGFESYVERAKSKGVRFVRCRPSAIKEDPATHNLSVMYYDNAAGRQEFEEFDMVVLSVGLRPPANVKEFSRKLDIETNEFGFCKTETFTPVETTRPGVYVCGPFVEPMDIPETVAQASGAASKAMTLLQESRGSLLKKKEYPEERQVAAEEPRVGVFVCHCGTNIAGVVDVERVVQYARTLPGVAYAERNLYTCSNDTQKRIREKIAEEKLNRVVVASCTPRTHEPLFRETLREGGLNQYLFEMANIRDQCSWVHMSEPERATEKAKDLVRMAIAKVRLDQPLFTRPLDIHHEALVIGGGIAGMTAASELADQGFSVILVEKEEQLGGYLRGVRYLSSGTDAQRKLRDLVWRVKSHKNITIHTSANLVDVKGSLGNFESKLKVRDEEIRVKHGVVIVATGAESYHPTEYLYGQDERVLRNQEMESRIADKRLGAKSVAFIQCVGSRNPERPYCSRTCCTESVKNATKIKEQRPNTDVYVLYREIRTYGHREKYYAKARELGVNFIRFADDQPPLVSAHNGRLAVTVQDEMLKAPVDLLVDQVVLATATVPREGNKELAQLLKVPLTEDKFFLEAHRKLRPVDFATDGIFVCGNAHSPLGIRETISQALGAAARASTILSKKQIELEPTISHVVEENCDGCAYCIDPCPFKAITLVEYQSNGDTKKRVQVNEAVCKGCGTCMATCPKKAIFVWHFRPEQLLAEVKAALGVAL